MNNEKLKPCPFCGGVADFRVRLINPAQGISQVKAVCMVCQAESPHVIMNMDDFRCGKGYLDAAKAAAARWNNRAE